MISTLDLEKAKKLIKSESKPVIVKAQNYDFNRKMLQYGKFDTLLISMVAKTSSLKKIDSGLDYIMAREAAKKGISIAVDLAELRSQEKKEKAIFLSQIMENIRVCRKAQAKLILLNHKSTLDVRALMASLGASSQQSLLAVKT